MANLLSNTTIGGYQSIHTGNIGSYALSLSGGAITGQFYINNGDPTIYLQDTNNRSAMIHVNSNVFYVLRGTGNNSTGWSTYNGYWPLELNLENNDAVFGGVVSAPAGSFRAPIFYDSQNTSYYLDPNSTSNLNSVNVNDINARYFSQVTNGVPSNNLGSPTITEMALFDEQFNNKTAFYNPASLTFWTSSDGTNFTEYTGFDTTTKKRFLGGDGDSGVVIPNQTNRFRIELENSAGYVFLNQLYIYWSSNSHITKVHIWVRRCDNNQWYQWTDSNTQVSSWPGHLYLPFNGIPFYPGYLASNGHFNKIRIEFIPTWSTGDYSTAVINLMRMQIWGGYPAGKRNIYYTDENQNVTFPASITSGNSVISTNYQATNAYYLNGTSYYLNSTNGGIYTNARFETAGNLVVGGNSYLGNGNGDEVHINDILRVGATDSGDAHFFFGEGSSAGSDYGSHWYWDSAYTFTWNTRNAGTDTALFDYVTNDTTYVNWRRNFHMQNREINYVSQLHFNGGTRFINNGSNYLNFLVDSTSYGGIQVRDGNSTIRGYSGYFDSNGFGLLNSIGTWGIRLNPGNAETLLFYAGNERLRTDNSGAYVTGRLDVSSYVYTPGAIIASNIQGGYQVLSLDTIKNPGLYQYDGGIGGAQPLGVEWSNVKTIEIGSESRYSQFVMPYSNSRIFYRIKTDAGWQSYVELITSGNIGSQSVSYASTAGALSSMNISQFTNNSGYVTSSSLSSYLPLAGGTMSGKIFTLSTGTGTYDGAFEIRETSYVTTSQSAWGYAPGITYHWGGRAASKVGLRSDGLFAIDNEPFATRSWTNSQGFLTSYTTSNTFSSTNVLGLNVSSGSYSYININSSSTWAWVRLSNNGSTSWDIASYDGGALEFRPYGSGTNATSIALDGVLSSVRYRLSGTGAYMEGYGSHSSKLGRVAIISFDWNSTYDEPYNHGIMSTNSNGDFADSISINSFNDITLRLDANNNNVESYVRVMNNTQGANTIAYIGHDGGSSVAWFGGVVTAANDFRAPIFYDLANTNYYGDFASTSVMNAIRFGTSSNNGTLSGAGDWGMRLTTDVGWIQFGPANSSYAHIYTDRPTFYFNKDILINGYSVITAANIGSQSVSYASTAGSAPNGSNTNQFYDVNAGVGNGLRFWSGSNGYKISMGVGSLYQYGPVSDYSIKMQMNDGDTGRGFVWGRESYAPIAALNSTSGDMEVAGYYKSYGYRGNGNVGGTGAASWHPDGIYVGSTQWLYGNMHKNGSSIYDVGELKMNGGPYLQTYNDRNLIVRGSSSSDVGIEGKNAAGSNVFQIYGNGSDYGFLNGTWAAWDIRKTKNGAMYMNNDNTYYLQTNSTSNFVALNIQGNAVIHAGNIGSQSVSYASSAGSVAWTNVSSRPTALSQFTNDLGNYGGWLTTGGKAADSELLDGVDSAYFVRGTGGSTFGKRTTALGGDSTQGLSSGFYDGSGMSNMPTSDWYHLIVNAHQNSYTGNQYEFQLATAFWDKSNFYVRSISPGDVGPWRTLVHNGNIGSQSVSYANSAGSASTAGSATMASQLSKYGDIYGDNWNTYYVSGKFIASAVLGMTGPNKPPTSYDYGVALSYGETGGPLMQWYFPENSANGTTIFKKGVYRTGWNGNWSSWKTLVEQEGDLCTIVGGAGTGLEVHGNVGYNQNPLTYFLLRGQADTSWKSFKVRLTGDAGGQDIEFRRIAENGADERMFWVPRVANQVIFDYFFVQASDERKKDNITIISNPIEKVKQLRGAEFDWNSGVNEGTHDVGLIAQDVEAVLPEAVTTQEDGYKNLAYNKVIPLLVEAMKEQQTMIEALRAEIELLKNK